MSVNNLKTQKIETFSGELNRQSRYLLLPSALLAIFSWIPYIPLDQIIHPDIPFIVSLRIGLTIIGIISLICFFIPKLKKHNYWILYALVLYLEMATGAILGLVNADPAYMGGFSMILMFIPLVPFKKRDALILVLLSIIVFLIVGYNNELTFQLKWKQYALLNVLFALLMATITTIILDAIRRRTFNKSELLRKQNAQIEEQKHELQVAIKKINTLKGFLPICSHCKNIRDGKGNWHNLENYITEHSNAEFTHSMCDTCIKKFYPKLKSFK